MNRLITGLPRTASTSVASALEDLGFKVYHYCSLTSNHELDYDPDEYDVVVTNDISVFAMQWDSVLILTRESNELADSIRRTEKRTGKQWLASTRLALEQFILNRIWFGRKTFFLNVKEDENPWLQLEMFMGMLESKTRMPFPHINFNDYQI